MGPVDVGTSGNNSKIGAHHGVVLLLPVSVNGRADTYVFGTIAAMLRMCNFYARAISSSDRLVAQKHVRAILNSNLICFS